MSDPHSAHEASAVGAVGALVEALRACVGEIVVRGLSATAPGDVNTLATHAAECARIGMTHVAARLEAVLRGIRSDARGTARHVLDAYTSLHVLERVLSLEVAEASWRGLLEASEAHPRLLRDPGGLGGTAPPREPKAPGDGATVRTARIATPAPTGALPPLPADDRKKLGLLLVELARTLEELVQTGLTAATEATRQRLDASFKEASRMKLLRLGASLRYVNEEVGRFVGSDAADACSRGPAFGWHAAFSQRRFVLFAHRSWLLAKGMSAALRCADHARFARLVGARGDAPTLVQTMDVVTIGVLKRTVQSACTFEFRLRVLRASSPGLEGVSLILPLVFARKNPDVTAEAFLHLPQPQRWNPIVLTEPRTITITGAAVALDERGGPGRLTLGPTATVTPTKPPKSWSSSLTWSPERALARVRAQEPGPLDLAPELQEEVVLTDWQAAEAIARATPERRILEVTTADGLVLDAIVPSGPDGAELGAHLAAAAKKKQRPALFGVVYYELGRLVLLPLSFVDAPNADQAPKHLMLSSEKINLSALLGNLDLR